MYAELAARCEWAGAHVPGYYRYLILAINSHGLESAISNIIEIGPPPAPTGVTAE
jgi:hypothetical protein